MKAALVSMVLALSLGISAAYGQQPGFSQPVQVPETATGGTCSSFAADCNTNCNQLETPSPACRTSCANKLNACVQSGMWHNGPDVTTNRQ